MNKLQMLINIIKMSKIKIEIERWKWNNEIGLYVSSYGRLKRFNGEIVNPKIRDNYLFICNHNGDWEALHRIVMKTFKPVKNANILTVDHLDHNTRNNRISNLEWVSQKENLERAKRDDLGDMTAHNKPITKVKLEELNQIMSLENAAKMLANTPSFKNANQPADLTKIMDNIWKVATKTTKSTQYGGFTWSIVEIGENE